MPTVAAGVGRAIMAGAFQPVDRARGLQAVDFQTQQQLQALRVKVNRALQVNDTVEASQLARQYMALSQRRGQLGLKVPKVIGAGLQTVGAAP